MAENLYVNKVNSDGDIYYIQDIDARATLQSIINNKGQANGFASLGEDGKVPAAQLPSYVDDVLEYTSKDLFPTTGETGKIYVDITTNKTYRWSGSAYVEISESLALGETSSTAYAGDKGKAVTDALTEHEADTSNPHNVTKTQVGLGNVENKSSATIRSELTSSDVTTALGYTPLETGVLYQEAIPENKPVGTCWIG